MTDSITCDDCGEAVQFQQNQYRTLSVGCDCDSRSVKVASVLPDEWSTASQDE